MRYIKITSIFLFTVAVYLILAYFSKQMILNYYSKQDKKIDWFAEYKETKIKDAYKIIFAISPKDVIADREAGKKMVQAAKNLGWEVHVFDSPLVDKKVIESINPDFILTNDWKSKIGLKDLNLKLKSYALLAHPINLYFGRHFSFIPKFREYKFPEVKFFDGFIISSSQISLFKKYIESKNKKFYGFYGYSSAQHQDYVEVKPKRIVYMGSNWDNKRKGSKFAKVFKTLAEQNNAVFYGPKSAWEHIVGDAYKGYIEGSGSAVIDILRENGINILLHSKSHFKNATPSSRVFEAASACVVGISDKNPFVMEHFGNNFLYIDTNKSAESIIKQINDHLDWIKKNPERVREMIKNNYDIYIKNFSLEQLLLKVAHMHEKILLDESKNISN